MPAIAGEDVTLYLRERVLAGVANTVRSAAATGKVVLFVHGATFPSTPGFEVAYQNHSWMAYLARAGFDVFAVDLTGYGRSTRPWIMDDPCNRSKRVSQGLLYVDAEGHAATASP